MSKSVDRLFYKTRWVLRKYSSEGSFQSGNQLDEVVINDNMLLNEGIQSWLTLSCGLGAAVAFDNANARLAVGNSTTAEAAAQTALQAVTPAFAGMESGYPQRAGQTVTWRAVFDGNTANFAWNEFGVDNGAAAGVLLNRRVSAQGVKVAGQVWTLDLQITLS